jgi:ribosome-associated protein
MEVFGSEDIGWFILNDMAFHTLKGDEFIKLGQALKKAGVVGSGVDAKMVILDGQVSVNGQTELQRGKKLHNGDVVTFQGETIQIVQ